MPGWIVKIYDDHSMNNESEDYLKIVEHNSYTDFFPDLSKDHLREIPNSFLIAVIDSDDENDNLIGLARGHSMWEWLYVRTLWVNEIYRNDGVGSELLKEVQELAEHRKCGGIHLETWNKNNLHFYEKNGFQSYGALEDFPKGHVRYSLCKRL